MTALTNTARSMTQSLGIVFFTPAVGVGITMVILLAATSPLAGLGALLCLAIYQSAAALLGFAREVRIAPAAVFNPFLVGAWVMGEATSLGQAALLISLSALACLLVERLLDSILTKYFAFPVLSLPFTLIGWMVLMII